MAQVSVTKKDVLNSVHKMLSDQGLELSKADVQLAIEAYQSTVMGALLHNNRCPFGKIGTLTPTLRSARVSRNPKTGEKIDVPAKVTIKYRASSEFSELLNSEDSPVRQALTEEE